MNQYELFWKYFKKTCFLILIFILLFLLLQYKEYQSYQVNTNQKINAILNMVKEKYPNVTKNELMEILNSKASKEIFVKEYGIDTQKESIILKNDLEFARNQAINFGFFLVVVAILIFQFLAYNKKKDYKIKDLIHLVEQINQRNYQLDFSDIMEDELSILKNEIYKTSIMLKEQAEISIKDKMDLKDSLSDISHQLKTPLTSILIILDNLTQNPSMEESLRSEFIHDIKREIRNIRFLTETLLKLSKLDSNTVSFIKKPVLVDTLIREAIINVQPLCDLKEIQIVCFLECQKEIIIDKKWQVEAFTNILKNSIEHSKKHSKIEIKGKQNHFYTTIWIKDFGTGISKDDLPHIFKRFYKGKNASDESIGIGLALSKKIIESNDGKISVMSDTKGTTFQIRYFHESTISK